MKSILCCGDSNTNGARNEFHRNYPLELIQIIEKEKGRFVYCINKGINGETTSHMLNRAYDVIRSYRDSDLMLFMGGTNDSKVPIPGDIYRENVWSIVSLAREFGLKPYIGLIPPVATVGLPNYSISKSNEVIGGYNKNLLKLCEEKQVSYADFRGFVSEDFFDGVHLNRMGDVKMARIWYEVIKGEL